MQNAAAGTAIDPIFRISMTDHLRFKRHIRFLQDGDVVRVVTDLDGGTVVPAGDAFDHLLAAIGAGSDENSVRTELAERMQVSAELVEALILRLFKLNLIERFDPTSDRFTRFDRQLLLLDALAPCEAFVMNQDRQQHLADAEVLILGLGGIGQQMALSLASAGAGAVVLVDGDIVEESNLHRQILLNTADIGRPKTYAVRDGLLRIAPSCRVRTRETMVGSAEEWNQVIGTFPNVRYVVLSADGSVDLVNWISAARTQHDYSFIKCGYMNTQGLIGPLLGPDTKDYGELFSSWAPLISAQPQNIKDFNTRSMAPTMAASNAIMANIAALELIKLITGAGALQLVERRLVLDLDTYSLQEG